MTSTGGPPDQDPNVIEATPGEVEVLGLARLFQEFADQVVTRLPLYRRLCEAAAADLFVVDRLRLADPVQRVPNLLLAAVHDVVLSGEDLELADWYPSMALLRGEGHGARRVGSGADDPWPHFRELALDHEGVAERLRTRATQTNEVGRCLPVFPALYQASLSSGALSGSSAMRPLGIVEVGASAGLNLRSSSYGYRYRLPVDGSAAYDDRRSVDVVGSGARLVLECQLRGPRVPTVPAGGLSVASAVGIDVRPLRVSLPDDARWLLACQWPEEIERLDRLRAAIELARTDPPVVARGDAVDDLAAHLFEVPPHALPVVVSSWVMTYLPVVRQLALVEVLDTVAQHRDVAFVFSEQPDRVPGLPVPPRPDGQPDGRATALVLMVWREGERRAIRLADHHPHGTWMEWLADSAAPWPLG